MSDWLWRYRGLVAVTLAAVTVAVLLQLAERAPEPDPPPRDPTTERPRPTFSSSHGSDGMHLTGRVSSDNATPIADATVCAQCDAPDCPDGALGVPLCTATDTTGAYRLGPLPTTLYWLTAEAAGHIPSTWDPGRGRDRVDLRQGGADIDLVLARGGAELGGTVVNLAGEPIAGALVGGLVGAATLSDEHGRFASWLAPGVARLEVRARGYATATVTASAPGNVRVTLRPGATITGRVLNPEDNTPIAGAHVGVGDDSYGVWRRRPAAVVTNADGHFEIAGLAAGRYTPYATMSDRYGEGDSAVLGPLQTVNVEIMAHPARAVTGAVRIDGQPCESGYLRLTSEADSTVVQRLLDELGRATLSPLLPGLYQASAYCHATTTPEGPTTVSIQDTDIEGLIWNGTRGTTLRGVVVTASGDPLARVRAMATRDGVTHGDTTRADGTFAISGLEPGESVVRAEVLGVPLSEETVATVGAGAAPVRIVALAPGKLVLRVVADESGEPLAGLEVSVQGEDRILTNTGSDGRTDVEQLAPGTYQVTVSHPVGGRVLRRDWVLGGSQKRIAIATGETATITIRVAGLVGIVEGWVVDQEGDPVADAAVTPRYREQLGGAAPEEHVLMFARHHNWRAVTGEEGAFSLTGLIPGNYDLCASHYSGTVGCVESVATRERATIVMEAAGSLAGTAVDPRGTTPIDLTLSAHEITRGLERSQRFLYREGRWLLDHLPAGTWELTAESSVGSGELTVALTPGQVKESVVIRLEPRATITGQVVAFADDRELAGVEVSLWPETASVVGVRRAVTDETGRFSLTGIPIGRAELRLQPPDGYVDFFGRKVDIPTGGGELGTTRLVRSPGEARAMYGFRPAWPPAGEAIAELRVLIEDVKVDSPAGLAGLRIGDAVVAINGVSVSGADHYLFWGLIAATPGTIKTVTLADGSELTMTAADYDWP